MVCCVALCFVALIVLCGCRCVWACVWLSLRLRVVLVRGGVVCECVRFGLVRSVCDMCCCCVVVCVGVVVVVCG